MQDSESQSEPLLDFELVFVQEQADFPEGVTRFDVSEFLLGDDDLIASIGREAILESIDVALATSEKAFGSMFLAIKNGALQGALVAMETGMKGYIPETLIAVMMVLSSERRKGIGSRLLRFAQEKTPGSIKCHVPAQSIARNFLEKQGFSNPYAEMRFESSHSTDDMKRLQSVVKIMEASSLNDLPEKLGKDALAEFLHVYMKPYEDRLRDVKRGLDYALGVSDSSGGFVLLGFVDDVFCGALVMLRTGVKHIMPENLLLFICVDPNRRKSGIGAALIREAMKRTDGPIKLHVEYINPAKRLYERLGFRQTHAEMRWMQ